MSRANAPADTEVPASIGGYRVVRVLSRSTRALTVLVHAESQTRVARVLAASCPATVIDAEVAVHDAIARAAPALRQHAVVLDDLVTLPDDRLALLLLPVTGPRLADTLAALNGRLALGHAVTVLAPLAEALDAAHQVGLTGLGLQPQRVRLSLDGAPVIIGVQDALAGPALPQRFRALEPAYAADHAGFDQLGAAVARAVEAHHRPALHVVVSSRQEGIPLAHALFDCATPLPLPTSDQGSAPSEASTDHVDVPGSSTSPLLAASPTGVPLEVGPSPSTGRLPVVIATLRELGLPASVVDPVQAAITAVAGQSAALRSRWRGVTPLVRPRYLLAGVAGGAALILAVSLVAAPAPVMGDDTPAGGADHSSAEREPGQVAAVVPSSLVGSTAPETALHPEPDEWQGIIETLVDRWVTCRAAASMPEAVLHCREGVAHAGSAAERLLANDDPRHAMLERWSATRGEAVVIERMGGAVLIDLVAAGTTTASLLVVRNEAGWRLRDVIG